MPHMDEGGAQDIRFATLEARIDRVADATIRKKWKKLPPSTHGASRDALSTARQQARARRGKAKTSQVVEDCVDEMLGRLHDRLPRIPYPPSTDESYFDHETNLNRVSKLQSQLANNSHAMKLLKAQIAKEEELLKVEEEESRHLEKNAADEESARRTRYSHLHPLAKDVGQDVSEIDILSLYKQQSETTQHQMATLSDDPQLQSLLEQLDNHLSSLSHNMEGIRSVSLHIEEARNELIAATNT